MPKTSQTLISDQDFTSIFSTNLFSSFTSGVLTTAITATLTRVSFSFAVFQGLAVGTAMLIEGITSNYDLPVIGKSPYLGAVLGGVAKFTITTSPSVLISIGKELVYVLEREQDWFKDYPIIQFGVALLLPIAVEHIGNELSSTVIVYKPRSITAASYELQEKFEQQINIMQHDGRSYLVVEGTKKHIQKITHTNEAINKIANPVVTDVLSVLTSLKNDVNSFMGVKENRALFPAAPVYDKFNTLLTNMQPKLDSINLDHITTKIASSNAELLHKDLYKSKITELSNNLLHVVTAVKAEMLTAIIQTQDSLTGSTVTIAPYHLPVVAHGVNLGLTQYLNLPGPTIEEDTECYKELTPLGNVDSREY